VHAKLAAWLRLVGSLVLGPRVLAINARQAIGMAAFVMSDRRGPGRMASGRGAAQPITGSLSPWERAGVRVRFIMDTARMLRPLATSALLALVTCSGCASWHYRKEADSGYASSPSTPGDGGIFQGLLQGLQNASMNDWNFGRAGWW